MKSRWMLSENHDISCIVHDKLRAQVGRKSNQLLLGQLIAGSSAKNCLSAQRRFWEGSICLHFFFFCVFSQLPHFFMQNLKINCKRYKTVLHINVGVCVTWTLCSAIKWNRNRGVIVVNNFLRCNDTSLMFAWKAE